jgi:hypothetical protein
MKAQNFLIFLHENHNLNIPKQFDDNSSYYRLGTITLEFLRSDQRPAMPFPEKRESMINPLLFSYFQQGLKIELGIHPVHNWDKTLEKLNYIPIAANIVKKKRIIDNTGEYRQQVTNILGLKPALFLEVDGETYGLQQSLGFHLTIPLDIILPAQSYAYMHELRRTDFYIQTDQYRVEGNKFDHFLRIPERKVQLTNWVFSEILFPNAQLVGFSVND